MRDFLALIVIILSFTTASIADDFNAILFGHSVEIYGETEETMHLDGKPTITDGRLTIDEITIVNGIPTLVGNSLSGGNACEGSPFIVSFPPSGQPRIDGPIEGADCALVTRKVEDTVITFSTAPSAGRVGKIWVWTPSAGLAEQASVEMQPDLTKGFATLRERTVKHPSDLFSYGEISSAISDLLGPDLGAYRETLDGTGSGKFVGDDYVGTACTPHMCGLQEALVFVSAKEHRIYAAWKPDQKKIEVRPPLNEWPDKAQAELATWARKWM
ncbi:hypothetical protein HKB47_20915 [Mesorhizobium japonicum]|uniref:Uncharacterized protein n=1 Tax=Mesorhizobium japonicum R7A TaxID=935547 RepID=A0ABX6MV04_9HYPH|nr:MULTISPECIES: hypothetical protein [Mesorhizobium]MBE1711179.1 hypothetical protein [Mesorhizobium japonicum]MBE1714672.1 hypothetical protein [Mesorhizobium japonicum]MUT22283.1 hypothetical protein [Mesorhizobium japonicum]MUT28296.1 hypothetical protein [Mesorhizobium japonicum]QJF03210.1 hypothetical protein R7A2020_20915 [Mesorhizobium japonicum R7A]